MVYYDKRRIILSCKVLRQKARPTKRAPDAGDSGAISSIFLRLSIFPVGRRSAARPSAGNANRWALATNWQYIWKLKNNWRKILCLHKKSKD